MIKTQNNIFYICGKNYTYVMYVNDMGFLQHAYYGGKIGFNDSLLYIKEICKKTRTIERRFKFGFFFRFYAERIRLFF